MGEAWVSYRSSQQTSWKHGTSANGLKDGYIVFYSMGTLCFTGWVHCDWPAACAGTISWMTTPIELYIGWPCCLRKILKIIIKKKAVHYTPLSFSGLWLSCSFFIANISIHVTRSQSLQGSNFKTFNPFFLCPYKNLFTPHPVSKILYPSAPPPFRKSWIRPPLPVFHNSLSPAVPSILHSWMSKVWRPALGDSFMDLFTSPHSQHRVHLSRSRQLRAVLTCKHTNHNW